MGKSNVPVPTHHRYRGRASKIPALLLDGASRSGHFNVGWVEPRAGLSVLAKGDLPTGVGNRTLIIQLLSYAGCQM